MQSKYFVIYLWHYVVFVQYVYIHGVPKVRKPVSNMYTEIPCKFLHRLMSCHKLYLLSTGVTELDTRRVACLYQC
jgi:hypothetical protein